MEASDIGFGRLGSFVRVVQKENIVGRFGVFQTFLVGGWVSDFMQDILRVRQSQQEC